jgi:hydroxylamine reductase
MILCPLTIWLLTLKTGEHGVKVMALLDEANTSKYGNPEITEVNIGVRSNPAILISGHDLTDLEQLLEQTEGTGVDVYTHSEMLPAHYYPAFKKYEHFAGNYGNAWWKQVTEFESFRGPILFTTNCIVPPKSEEVRSRIFTTGSTVIPDASISLQMKTAGRISLKSLNWPKPCLHRKKSKQEPL